LNLKWRALAGADEVDFRTHVYEGAGEGEMSKEGGQVQKHVALGVFRRVDHWFSKQQAASSKQQAASSKQQAASSKQQAASSKLAPGVFRRVDHCSRVYL